MIGIRTDANGTIAMGHLMRCMSIAKQLKKMGQDVLFIISENYAETFILENGFECVCLHNRYDEKEKETDTLIGWIRHYQVKKLIVDSYEVTFEYLAALHKWTYLVYLDDLNRFVYPVDMLVNYSLGADRSLYGDRNYDEKKVKMLLGTGYVPLREVFSQKAIAIKPCAESVFITTGGTDEFDMINGIIRRMNQSACRDMKKYVVAGKFYRYRELLTKLQQVDETVEAYVDIPDIWRIMRKADLAVSAGGTTLAELCSCGLPTICFTMADNQLAGAGAFAQAGLMYYAGDVRSVSLKSDEKGEGKICGEEVAGDNGENDRLRERKSNSDSGRDSNRESNKDSRVKSENEIDEKNNRNSDSRQQVIEKIVETIITLRGDYDRRYEMAVRAKAQIDGQGAERIAKELL